MLDDCRHPFHDLPFHDLLIGLPLTVIVYVI